jgi:hypothetical protein
MSICDIVIGKTVSNKDVFGRPKGFSGGTLQVETLRTRVLLGMKIKDRSPKNPIEFDRETGEYIGNEQNQYHTARRLYRAVGEAIQVLEQQAATHSTNYQDRTKLQGQIELLTRILGHQETTLATLKPTREQIDYRQEGYWSGTPLEYRGEDEELHKFTGRDENRNRYTLLVEEQDKGKYRITACVSRWDSGDGPHSEIRRVVDLSQNSLAKEIEFTYLTLEEETQHAERHVSGIRAPRKR